MVKMYVRGLLGQRAVSQFEPTPLISTRESGRAHEADNWMRLDRSLILGTIGGRFYVCEREHTAERLDVVRCCVAGDGLRVVRRIVEIGEAGRAPKSDPCIVAFAVASVDGDVATKRAVYENFGRVLRIPTHQMHFAQFREAVGGGWGSGLKRAYGKLFNKASPRDLAYDAVSSSRATDWRSGTCCGSRARRRPTPITTRCTGRSERAERGRIRRCCAACAG